MNKLRGFVVGGCLTLSVALAFVGLHYGLGPASRDGYVTALVAVALLPTIPLVAAHAKFALRRLAEYRRNGSGLSFERDSIFVSADTVGDAERALSDIEAAVEAADEYDECRRDRFGEGRGLNVRHTGFHNSFVRVASDGRLVVTGASQNTHSLASLVERVASLTMERTRSHPFFARKPVRGAPRAFLGLALVVVFVFGAGGVVGAAYPADAYSAPERVVLVGYDTRAVATPGYDATDATLDKAAFLVDSLGEEAVEIGWDRDDADKLTTHGRQAVFLSETVSTQLGAVREDASATGERERVAALEADLHAAECRVAARITSRVESGNVAGDASALVSAGESLRASAADAGYACATEA
ncbi:hypothetical protein [Haloferax denitrificans]|uniref:Uncharacterized protein n=1 Tax=Haloferax denitrificans ATCC 35960 TaxID=662478 RepID=M0JBX8_9EURY|nr:hypothetical protein [Haloferax denitrificans]EMA06481.1 hypothetical protein C438_07217 [Haloferax denitrificans ATCC 35960]